jgi:flavin-dependent dehydrogenase
MGGIYAGASIRESISDKDDRNLERYQRNWNDRFKNEFEKMLVARRMLERLDNKALDEIVSAVPAAKLEEASRTGDFDFHTAAITKILSSKVAVNFAKVLLKNEIRRLFDG